MKLSKSIKNNDTSELYQEEEKIVKNIRVTKDNIEDLIEKWHESNSDIPIYEYLGMTQAEYFKWVETDELTYKEPVVLATHNGTFHADDVFAYSVLKTVFPAHELIRSRNPETLAKADIVFDVGGGVYDHHSTDKEYRELRENQTESSSPYAAFGLIWRDFGHQFLQAHGVDSKDDRSILFERIDQGFIEAVDAFDNGVEVIPADRPHAIAVQTASSLISDFNIHGHDEESEQVAFQLATQMAEVMLTNTLLNYRKVLDEKAIVVEAFASREEKELLILPTGCNWKRNLAEIDTDEEVKFVVYPDTNEGYRIQVVTVSPTSFEARKDLPADWAGKRDEELNAIIGIDDSVFCHPGRFLAGAKSEQSILTMAKQALNA